MTLAVLLFLTQVIPFDLRIETPWVFCDPDLIVTVNGRPLPPTLTLYRGEHFPDLQIRSSCRVAVWWFVRCDLGLGGTQPGEGIAQESESPARLESGLRSPGGVQLECRVFWTPCQQSDLDGDCRVDWEDLVMLDATQAVNTLEGFAWMQREWGAVPTPPEPFPVDGPRP